MGFAVRLEVGHQYEAPEGTATVDELTGIDLHIPAGELTVLMRPSGSGKSTLLNLIGGIDRPSAGRVFLDDTDITTPGASASSLSITASCRGRI